MAELTHAPESPVVETWRWQTDVMVSDNSTEQRVELLQYPKRSFQEDLVFTERADIQRELGVMLTSFGFDIWRPLYAYQTPLVTTPELGHTSLDFVARLTEVRALGRAYIYDRDGGELVDVDTVTSGGCTLDGSVSRNYGRDARVCPAVAVYSGNNAALSRRAVDDAAEARLTLREVGFMVPFVNEFNTQELALLNNLPILDRRPMGEDFEESYDTGLEVTDHGGIVDIRDPWGRAKVNMPRRFLSQRVLDSEDWDWWRVFADYAKGATNPFYVPSFREDFVLHTAPSLGGTTLVFAGLDYLNNYFPLASYKGVAITAEAGVHYAQVSNCTNSGGNSLVTFTPALPGTAGWDVGTEVSMLMLCRIADDTISCYHHNLHTEIELVLRTVDA